MAMLCFLIYCNGLIVTKLMTIQVALVIYGLLIRIGKKVQNVKYSVKDGLAIRKFKIRGPKWRNVSTANNEGNLYTHIISWTSLFYIKSLVGSIMFFLAVHWSNRLYQTAFFSVFSLAFYQAVTLFYLRC